MPKNGAPTSKEQWKTIWKLLRGWFWALLKRHSERLEQVRGMGMACKGMGEGQKCGLLFRDPKP